MPEEPFKRAEHRGSEIAYEVRGDGPPVVLQHGFLGNRQSWAEHGVTSHLSDAYRLILVDSLGHGDSDKPGDPSAYRRQLRAGDIAAVLNQEGIERAHYVGYSMGSWIGTGVAIHHADRLLSLTLGGWDPVDGVKTVSPTPLTFEAVIEIVGSAAPDLVARITPEAGPGLRAGWDALGEVDGSREALADCGVPVLIWDGLDDPFHGPADDLAGELGMSFFSVPGDHITALYGHGGEAGRGIRAFLDQVPR